MAGVSWFASQVIRGDASDVHNTPATSLGQFSRFDLLIHGGFLAKRGPDALLGLRMRAWSLRDWSASPPTVQAA